jgi:hypothetical protein
MKHLILVLTILSCQLSQAETTVPQPAPGALHFKELVLDTNFEHEYGHYRLWNEQGKFFIEQFGNSDRSPSATSKVEVSPEKISFIKMKLEEMNDLSNSKECETRQITANFKIDHENVEHKGCVDSKDAMSEKLNQLSTILMMLI